jgi:pyrroloquinoline quinone biosynthesis protein B
VYRENAGGRDRTDTGREALGILSPARLPISPLRPGPVSYYAPTVRLLLVLAAVAIAFGASPQSPAIAQASGWELVVLGIAQDAGIPQLGCEQALCRSIREGKRRPERVASLGLINTSLNKAYLFDATPDFRSQVHSLTGGRAPDGIFLTHGHIGHYTGLMYLGRESIDASRVPVYGTERMTAFLRSNGPWSLLVSRNNIDPRVLRADEAVVLEGGLRVTAFTVPHRDEFTDTVGYLIEGPRRKVVYIPDIDQWQRWDRPIRDVVSGVNLAFLDGTFASADEIPGRSVADIPHPLIPATRELLKGVRAEVWFIHLNHTNGQIDAKDVVKDGARFGI